MLGLVTGTEVAVPETPMTVLAHAPPGVQELALVVDQLRVTGEPASTVVGRTAKLSPGTGAGRVTFTVTLATADPQVSV